MAAPVAVAEVHGDLTPAIGFHAAAGRLAPAPECDLVLEDRWLVARGEARVAPWCAEPQPAAWPGRVAVAVPGRYRFRDAGQRQWEVELTGQFAMGYADEPTYRSLAVALRPVADGEHDAFAVAGAPPLRDQTGELGGTAAIEVALQLRPENAALLGDGTVVVEEGSVGRLARVRLADGQVLATGVTQAGLCAGLVADEATGRVYRLGTTGQLEVFELDDLTARDRLVLPAPGAALPRVLGAVLERVAGRLVVVGAHELWVVTRAGQVVGPTSVAAGGELTAGGFALTGTTLHLLVSAAEECPPQRLTVDLATLRAGAPEALTLQDTDDPSQGLALTAAPQGGLVLCGTGADGAWLDQGAAPGQRTRVGLLPDVPHPVVTSDGRLVALWTRRGSPGGATLQCVTRLPDCVVVTGVAWAALAPDGRSLVTGDVARRCLRRVPLPGRPVAEQTANLTRAQRDAG